MSLALRQLRSPWSDHDLEQRTAIPPTSVSTRADTIPSWPSGSCTTSPGPRFERRVLDQAQVVAGRGVEAVPTGTVRTLGACQSKVNPPPHAPERYRGGTGITPERPERVPSCSRRGASPVTARSLTTATGSGVMAGGNLSDAPPVLDADLRTRALDRLAITLRASKPFAAPVAPPFRSNSSPT